MKWVFKLHNLQATHFGNEISGFLKRNNGTFYYISWQAQGRFKSIMDNVSFIFVIINLKKLYIFYFFLYRIDNLWNSIFIFSTLLLNQTFCAVNRIIKHMRPNKTQQFCWDAMEVHNLPLSVLSTNSQVTKPVEAFVPSCNAMKQRCENNTISQRCHNVPGRCDSAGQAYFSVILALQCADGYFLSDRPPRDRALPGDSIKSRSKTSHLFVTPWQSLLTLQALKCVSINQETKCFFFNLKSS